MHPAENSRHLTGHKNIVALKKKKKAKRNAGHCDGAEFSFKFSSADSACSFTQKIKTQVNTQRQLFHLKQNVKNPTFKIFNTVWETVKVKAETHQKTNQKHKWSVLEIKNAHISTGCLDGQTQTKIRGNSRGGKNTFFYLFKHIIFPLYVVSFSATSGRQCWIPNPSLILRTWYKDDRRSIISCCKVRLRCEGFDEDRGFRCSCVQCHQTKSHSAQSHVELVWPQEHANKQQRLVTLFGHSFFFFFLPLDPLRQLSGDFGRQCSAMTTRLN